MTEKKEAKLGIFEKYLTLWIAICIVVGLLLGRFFPRFGQYLDSLKFAKLSIPIGICLFFMMYPTVVGIAFSDIKKAVRKPRPMLLTIIANWVIAPPIMTLYANLLVADPIQRAGIILLGMSPCTAMVMWWMLLAKGDLAQGLINTAINALLMVILYAPMSAFYLGVSGIPIPWDLIAISVIIFIALPVSLGAASRKLLIRRKGKEWFESTYLELVRRISIIALLLTLIVMFSFQGEIILNNPLLVASLAAPNLLHYVTMIAITYTTSWLSNWDYATSIDTTLIGSSSHFEVAIAVATTLYGLNSGAALATVIGPLMEVPLMLALVRVGLRTRHLFPRNKRKANI
ncbi:MAG: ACR3 family arsenite efflux transporter [Candidatus Bathyarchaeota archaeon]|nr:ACR3 family arsenite efflux transporter [Candidatus Bathyarchaeota archaeon]MDH5733007.1 ACR3 family arsenite efflux transporter [Candidatus Bathyarchaeota archaeon]